MTNACYTNNCYTQVAVNSPAPRVVQKWVVGPSCSMPSRHLSPTRYICQFKAAGEGLRERAVELSGDENAIRSIRQVKVNGT